MRKLTVADIMDMAPCVEYHRERVTELWAGRESRSARRIHLRKVSGVHPILAATEVIAAHCEP